MLLVILPVGIDYVTRNFSYRLLVSRKQAAQRDLENMFSTWYLQEWTYKNENVNKTQYDTYDNHMII